MINTKRKTLGQIVYGKQYFTCSRRVIIFSYKRKIFPIKKRTCGNPIVFRPTQWCSGQSVRFAVDRSGVHSPCRVIPKDFKKWYPQLPCLALGIYGRLWRTSRQVRLLCPWAKHLTGRPTFMWKTGDPEMVTPKRVRTYRPKHSDTSLTREWRINMANKKKKS